MREHLRLLAKKSRKCTELLDRGIDRGQGCVLVSQALVEDHRTGAPDFGHDVGPIPGDNDPLDLVVEVKRRPHVTVLGLVMRPARIYEDGRTVVNRTYC